MLSLGKTSYWRNVNPTGAVGDFIAVWKQAGGRRWPFVAMALSMTLGVFYVIAAESWKGPPPKPKVIYINSWSADRSDAEIRKTNLENQKLQDRLAKEQAEREEKVRNIYRTLGKVSGMDVDAIEKKAREDEAREKAARDKAIGLKPGATPAQAEPVEAARAAPAPEKPTPEKPPVARP
jgi:hypothetical protein